MLNRRSAILALLALPLGDYRAWAYPNENNPGRLSINLDQWSGIVVQRGGRSITISTAEIFRALQETK